MKRILIVEDDPNLAEGLAYNLERDGYDVLQASDGPSGLRLARERSPDLIVLDVMLPELGGFDVLDRLRGDGRRTPVIVLSALGEEVHRLRGFDAGADDYVVKPFSVAELLARIRLRLRERVPAATEDFALAGGRVHLGRLEFIRAGERIGLTPTEVDLLRALHAQVGVPVTREELLETVWGVGGTASRTLDTHVARLRRKVECDPHDPRHIVTVHSVGYRLDP